MGYLKLGDSQKAGLNDTTAVANYKLAQISSEVREKDMQVHESMKKQNVHFGSVNGSLNTEAKSKFQTYNKDVIDKFNGKNPANRNLIKSIYIGGSPRREQSIESKLSTYGENITANDALSIDLAKNKQMKQVELSHAFNLGYSVDTHKRAPSLDVTANMKHCDEILKECEMLKHKNERQNFKYTQPIGSRKVDMDLNSNYGANRYVKPGGQKEKPPMDYWKTNFTLNQIARQPSAKSVLNSLTEPHEGHLKPSFSTTKDGLIEVKGPSFKTKNGNVLLMKNKANSLRSNVMIGAAKGEFGTSYSNQYSWKNPKAEA